MAAVGEAEAGAAKSVIFLGSSDNGEVSEKLWPTVSDAAPALLVEISSDSSAGKTEAASDAARGASFCGGLTSPADGERRKKRRRRRKKKQLSEKEKELLLGPQVGPIFDKGANKELNLTIPVATSAPVIEISSESSLKAEVSFDAAHASFCGSLKSPVDRGEKETRKSKQRRKKKKLEEKEKLGAILDKEVNKELSLTISLAAPAPLLVVSSKPSYGETKVSYDNQAQHASFCGGLISLVDEEKKQTRKRKRRRKKKQLKEKEKVDVIADGRKSSRTSESMINKHGLRYFNPWESNWEACSNCGEEGHRAANCMSGKRRKPCFICSLFGHNGRRCLKGQECSICRRRGHHGNDCLNKNKETSQYSEVCLRCGEKGHPMSLCRNDYSLDDLKKIKCYICDKYGHLCCANFTNTPPSEIFCYICAQPGHIGFGCPKASADNVHVESLLSQPSTLQALDEKKNSRIGI